MTKPLELHPLTKQAHHALTGWEMRSGSLLARQRTLESHNLYYDMNWVSVQIALDRPSKVGDFFLDVKNSVAAANAVGGELYKFRSFASAKDWAAIPEVNAKQWDKIAEDVNGVTKETGVTMKATLSMNAAVVGASADWGASLTSLVRDVGSTSPQDIAYAALSISWKLFTSVIPPDDIMKFINQTIMTPVLSALGVSSKAVAEISSGISAGVPVIGAALALSIGMIQQAIEQNNAKQAQIMGLADQHLLAANQSWQSILYGEGASGIQAAQTGQSASIMRNAIWLSPVGQWRIRILRPWWIDVGDKFKWEPRIRGAIVALCKGTGTRTDRMLALASELAHRAVAPQYADLRKKRRAIQAVVDYILANMAPLRISDGAGAINASTTTYATVGLVLDAMIVDLLKNDLVSWPEVVLSMICNGDVGLPDGQIRSELDSRNENRGETDHVILRKAVTDGPRATLFNEAGSEGGTWPSEDFQSFERSVAKLWAPFLQTSLTQIHTPQMAIPSLTRRLRG